MLAVVGIGGYVWMNQNQDKLIPKEDIVYELGDKVDLDAKNFLDEKMSKEAIKETKLTSTLMTDTKKYTFDKKQMKLSQRIKNSWMLEIMKSVWYIMMKMRTSNFL